MYVERPEFAATLEDLVRGRPAQPAEAFLAQIEAVAHDASAVLGEIDVPTLITLERAILSAPRASQHRSRTGSPGASSSSSTRLSHAGLHEDPETFNRATLEFLLRNRE